MSIIKKISGWVFSFLLCVSPIYAQTCILETEPMTHEFFFFPNNNIIAGVDESSQIKLWSDKTGRLLQVLKGHSDTVFDLTLLEYEPVLVSAGKDGKLKYWDVVSGKLIKEIQLHQNEIQAVSFDRNRKYVAVIVSIVEDPYLKRDDADKKIFLFDLYKGMTDEGNGNSLELSGHKASIATISFSPYDDLLVSGDKNGKLIIWDTKSWEQKFNTDFKGESIVFTFYHPTLYSLVIQTEAYEKVDAYTGGLSYRTIKHGHKFNLFLGIPSEEEHQRPNAKPIPSVRIRAGELLVAMSNDGQYMLVATQKLALQFWETKLYNAN